LISLDTSVALAELLAGDRRAPDPVWQDSLVSSRLLEYELWTRLHALGEAPRRGDAARDLLARVALVELLPTVLSRALEPFPQPVRTLDALHLSTLHYLLAARQRVSLATFDERMRRCAGALGMELAF